MKKEQFDDSIVTVAMIAKALSHPARCSILQILSKYKVCNAMDIVAELPLSQSTVSQHLQELKNAGLIKGVPDGTRIHYSIRNKNLSKAEKAIRKYFKSVQKSDKE